MATYRIQDRSFDFACRVVELHKYLSSRRGTARTMATQVLRSGTSVGANLEEADAAQSKADFIGKCSIAAKEMRETHYWLRLLAATNLVSRQRITPLIKEANELVAILTTIIKKASSNPGRRRIQHSTFNIQHS